MKNESVVRGSWFVVVFLHFCFLYEHLSTNYELAFSEEDSSGGTVKITSPFPGQHLRGTFTVQLECSLPGGVAQVILLRDGAFLNRDTDLPYDIPWDTRGEAEGPHTLLARALSADGNEVISEPVTVTVDNTPPTVSWVRPDPKTVVAGPILLEAQAHDIIGLAEVRFSVDGQTIGSAAQAPFTLEWDSTRFSNGIKTVQARAVDQAGNSTPSEPIEVRVANPNRPPVVAPIGSKTIQEGETLSFILTAFDPDGARDPLTFQAEGLPPWASFDSKTGEFRATPDFAVADSSRKTVPFKVGFKACDPEPLCRQVDLIITVVDRNLPPSLKAIPDQKIHEGEPILLTVEPADNPDNDPLEFTAKGLPSWLRFDAGSRTLSGTPDFKICSTEEPERAFSGITIEACESEGTEPECAGVSFAVTVLNRNRPPAFKPIGVRRIDEGDRLDWEVQANDPDGDKIKLSAEPLPRGAVFTDHEDGTGTLRWKTKADQAGEYAVSFTAMDEKESLSDKEAGQISVREVSMAISGTVADLYGKTFAGAIIHIKGGGTDRKVTTDENGFYLVDRLSPGKYILRPADQPELGFSTEVTTLKGLGAHFSPLSRSVTLDRSDQTKVDFTVLQDK